VIDGAGLIEIGRERGTYRGGSRGVSVRVMKGVSYRVGAHRGEYVPRPHVQKVVDTGTAVITNHRVVFQGAGKTREWAFSKLIGIDHAAGVGASMIHISNRQRASGLASGEDAADEIRFQLELVLAHHSSTLDRLLAQLKAEIARLEHTKPTPPGALPGGAISLPPPPGPVG